MGVEVPLSVCYWSNGHVEEAVIVYTKLLTQNLKGPLGHFDDLREFLPQIGHLCEVPL